MWKGLWCDIIFQGINDNKALSHVTVTRGIDIKSCFPAIDKYHLSILKHPQHLKSANKGILNYHLHKVIYYITHLKDKSSAVIDSSIYRKSRIMSSSNIPTMSVISFFTTGSSTSANSNKIIHKNFSCFFGDNNLQK